MIEEMIYNSTIENLLNEIKNPLTVCNGYIDICMKNGSNEKYLKIIKEELKRTINIISKVNNNDIKNFDLLSLIKDVKSILDSLYKEENTIIKILTQEKVFIRGDYNKLKQVLINILKNSLESKDKNSLIIKIKIEDQKNNSKIIVEDNGCGIKQELLDKIYTKHFTTKKTGTGLGIPFIKNVIERHNGTIEYKSKEKIGTQVIIKLPK